MPQHIDTSGWRPISDLLTSPALAERVQHTRAVIGVGGDDPASTRAVASTMALGLFARILSPVLGAYLIGSSSLDPDPATTFWQPTDRGPVPLGTSVPLVAADPDGVLERLILPLVAVMSDLFMLSRRVLLGNAAAAVVGACTVVEATDPSLATKTDGLRRRLLISDALAGTGTESGTFVRNSCCLIYRLPMGYICGNCILVARNTKTARARAVDVRPPRRIGNQSPP